MQLFNINPRTNVYHEPHKISFVVQGIQSPLVWAKQYKNIHRVLNESLEEFIEDYDCDTNAIWLYYDYKHKIFKSLKKTI